MTDNQAILSEREQAKELAQAEKFLDSLDLVDNDGESEYDEDWTEADENYRLGVEAGEKFINNHIVSKINLFLDVYRKKGYTDDFLNGFMSGLTDAAGGITFNGDSEETSDSTLNE